MPRRHMCCTALLLFTAGALGQPTAGEDAASDGVARETALAAPGGEGRETPPAIPGVEGRGAAPAIAGGEGNEAVQAAAETEAREAARAAGNGQSPDDAASEGGAKAMLGMSILGNQEAPKSLVIVPWKSSEIGDGIGVSRALDTRIRPVDKDVFARELRYYEIRSAAAD